MQTKTTNYQSLLNDYVFKYIFGNSKLLKYTEYLLELLLNLEINSLEGQVTIINSFSLEKTSYDERGLEIDVKVKMPNCYLDLEAYTHFKLIAKIKSTMYISHMFATQLDSGKKLNEVKPHMQINFIKEPNEKSRTYSIISEDEDCEHFLGNYFKIKVINVDEYKDKCYNELDKLSHLLKFMSAESREEELEIIKGDVILENIHKDKEEFLQSEWARNFFTHENFVESVHNYELEEKDKIIEEKNNTIEEKNNTIEEAIKAFAKEKRSIEEIAKILKLNIQTVQEILDKN